MQTFSEAEVLTILGEVIGMPEDSRAMFLSRRCAGRESLKVRIEELLQEANPQAAFPIFQLEGPGPQESPRGPQTAQDLYHFPTAETHAEDATRIGPYRLLSVLGEGGMGVVYRAEQSSPQRNVALKVLHPRFLLQEGFRRRFEREIELLGRLDHPGIARIYDAGSAAIGDRHIPYIAMELIDGEPLLTYAAEACPSLPSKLELIAQIADAVHAAHQKAVVHRDLKPGNILVNKAGLPKILDFGIATSTDLDVQQVHQTQAGEILGTLAYMSPEQARSEAHKIDARTDIYSLGLIGYEILAGKRAFESEGQPIAMALQAMQRGEPAPLSKTDPRFQGDLESIFSKACRLEPEQRYGSAAALAEDIRCFLDRRPISARSASTAYELRKFVQRNRVVVSLAGAVLLALLVGGIGSAVGFVKAARSSDLATKRAEDLEKVTEYQAARLSRIDRAKMAMDLREGLIRILTDRFPEDLDADELQEREQSLVNSMVGADFPGLTTEILQTHIFAPALSEIDSQFPTQPRVQAHLLQSLASTYRIVGLHELARGPQSRALAMREEPQGDGSPEAMESMLESGLLLSVQGQYPAAQDMMQQAIQMGGKILAPDDPRRFDANHDLAAVLKLQGDPTAARKLEEQVVRDATRVLGAQHPKTLAAQASLAAWHRYEGELKQAREIGTQALAAQRQVLESGHPDLLSSQQSLASTLRGLGLYEDALLLEREVLDERMRTLGQRHPDTNTSMNNMAITLVLVGRNDEALDWRETALGNFMLILGDQHADTMLAMANLAQTLQADGQSPRALKLMKQAVATLRKITALDHPNTLTVLHNYGLLLHTLKKLEHAQEVMQEVVDMQMMTFGRDDPATLKSTSSLVAILTSRKDYQNAEDLANEVIAGQSIALGPKHRDTLHTKQQLATIYKKIGDYEKANALYQSVIEQQSEILRPDDPMLLFSLLQMADNYYWSEDYSKAIPIFETLVNLKTMKYGEGYPDTLLTMAHLARSLGQQGDYDRAQEIKTIILEQRRVMDGNQHPNTLRAILGLASTHHDKGEFDLACSLLQKVQAIVATQSDVDQDITARIQKFEKEWPCH